MKKVGDMIASLYNLPKINVRDDIKLHKAFVSDLDQICEFVDREIPEHLGWKKEILYAITQSPIKVVLATKDNELLGFACYDSSAKGFFGPIGVKKDKRNQGIGTALVCKTMEYMKSDGYAYAIIGWVTDAEEFYKKTLNAKWIENSSPDKSVYSNKINLKF